MSLPEVHLVGGSRAEAVRLAPVAIAMRRQNRVKPVLVAGGPDPLTFAETMAVFDLAPAPLAAMNLFDEKVIGGDVLLTGNTGVDAARLVRHRRQPWADPQLAALRGENTDNRRGQGTDNRRGQGTDNRRDENTDNR